MRVKLAIWQLVQDACELLKKRDSCSNLGKQVSKAVSSPSWEIMGGMPQREAEVIMIYKNENRQVLESTYQFS